MSTLHTQFKGDKIRNHVLYPTPLIALEMSDKVGAVVDTIFCLTRFACRTSKIQKYYFLYNRPRAHPEWRGATRLDTGAPKVPFSAKMTKLPLVNPKLIEIQTKLKSPQNSTFHSFTSNLSFSERFGKFDQVWPEVDSRRAPKTLILIRSSKLIETKAIAKIIKFLVPRLFTGQNQS